MLSLRTAIRSSLYKGYGVLVSEAVESEYRQVLLGYDLLRGLCEVRMGLRCHMVHSNKGDLNQIIISKALLSCANPPLLYGELLLVVRNRHEFRFVD